MTEAEFRRLLADEGYGEPARVAWEANLVNDSHAHDFDARILVIEGRITVDCDGDAVTCGPGDSRALAAGTPHVETIGPQGVTFLAGRRTP